MLVAIATAALSASAVYSQTISPDIATTGLQSYVPPSFIICSKLISKIIDRMPNCHPLIGSIAFVAMSRYLWACTCHFCKRISRTNLGQLDDFDLRKWSLWSGSIRFYRFKLLYRLQLGPFQLQHQRYRYHRYCRHVPSCSRARLSKDVSLIYLQSGIVADY